MVMYTETHNCFCIQAKTKFANSDFKKIRWHLSHFKSFIALPQEMELCSAVKIK